jgi:hypothetical protein
VNFYISDFSRRTGPILTKLGTKYPRGKIFKIVQMKESTLLLGGDNSKRVKIH